MATAIEGSDPRLPRPPVLTLAEARAYAGRGRRIAGELIGHGGILRRIASTIDEERCADMVQRGGYLTGEASLAALTALDTAAALAAEAEAAKDALDVARLEVEALRAELTAALRTAGVARVRRPSRLRRLARWLRALFA